VWLPTVPLPNAQYVGHLVLMCLSAWGFTAPRRCWSTDHFEQTNEWAERVSGEQRKRDLQEKWKEVWELVGLSRSIELALLQILHDAALARARSTQWRKE
jgi:hypothetical protein